MPYETIVITQNESIATLTLNRPERLNAITRLMVRELIAALAELEQDGWHVRRLQDDEARRLERALVEPH